MVTSTPITIAKKEAIENAKNDKNLRTTTGANKDGKNLRSNLARVLCIKYPIAFRKKSVSVLFNSNSKVNVIYPTFTKELGLSIKLTNVGIQKINSNMLDTYKIIVVAFLVTNKAN